MRRNEEEQERSQITDEGLLGRKAVSRREFLKLVGIAGTLVGVGGGLGSLLSGCGGGATTTTAVPTTTVGVSTSGEPAVAATVSTGPQNSLPPGKDKIVIGAARPISGALSFFEANAFGPIYKMWANEVNAAGGMNIGGTKLPVEMKVYDDQSNLDTSMRLITKLIEEDHVDFVFPPTSTAFVFAAAGVCSAHKYILMSSESGASSLEKEMNEGKLPYFFQFLNYSNHNQIPVLADILKEVGAKTCVFLYIDDLHGIEYQSVAQYYLPAAGVKILQNTAIPPDTKDMSATLKQAQRANPDVLWIECYPEQNILAMKQLLQINYSPKMVGFGPGACYQFMADAFGNAFEGVAGMGAWNTKSTPAAKAFQDKFVAFMGGHAENSNWWGGLMLRGEVQFFQAAVEKAGTLDQDVIKGVMETEHFQTDLGDTFMTNRILDISCYPGQIGQWQKGIFEVIDPGDKRTAPPIYPKAPYPTS